MNKALHTLFYRPDVSKLVRSGAHVVEPEYLACMAYVTKFLQKNGGTASFKDLKRVSVFDEYSLKMYIARMVDDGFIAKKMSGEDRSVNYTIAGGDDDE